MRRLFALAVTLVLGAGLPLSQLAIRHFGRAGAAGVTAVSAGILVADLANLAAGSSQGTVRRLVRIETATAAAATVTGAILLLDPEVHQGRDVGWEVGRAEMIRRLTLGLLFGILSARFRAANDRREALGDSADAPA